MDSDTYPDNRVIQLSGQFVPIKLDAEKEGQAAAKKYGVQGYPTILFVDGDGKVVYRTAGYQPPEGFSGMMSRVLDLKHVPEWETQLKAHPNDMGLISKLGNAAAMKDDRAGATNYANLATLALDANGSPANWAKYADLMNAVGDMFQTGEKYETAIIYFEKAAKCKTVSKAAYALFSEGYCYLSLNKPQQALDAAKRAEALPGLSKSDADTVASLKQTATQMLGKG